MMGEQEESGFCSERTSTVASGSTPFTSPSLHRPRPIRIRIRPQAPLKQRPILVPCSENTTVLAFKQRIAILLNVKHVRLEIEGFTIAEDCLIGDIIRESDVVNAYSDQQSNGGEMKGSIIGKRMSSSSSSESDSSETSSCESSSSESSSSSSSDNDSSSSSGDSIDIDSAPSQNWVPPGHGLSRTRRNNQRRRKKIRNELDAERESRMIETIQRAEKRAALGVACDEEIFQKEKGKGREQTVALKKPEIRRILPPSQRDEAVPSCIRLTRVDCDDCTTPWPVEEDEDDLKDPGQAMEIDEDDEDTLYAAFKRQGQEALHKMREAEMRLNDHSDSSNMPSEDDLHSQQVLLGLPIAFGKPKGWDGNDVLTSKQESNGKQSVQSTLSRLRQLRDQANNQFPSNGSTNPIGGEENMKKVRSAALTSIKSKKTGPEVVLSLPPGGGLLGLPSLESDTISSIEHTPSQPIPTLSDKIEEDVSQSLDYGEPEDEEKERKVLQQTIEKIRQSRTVS